MKDWIEPSTGSVKTWTAINRESMSSKSESTTSLAPPVICLANQAGVRSTPVGPAVGIPKSGPTGMLRKDFESTFQDNL